METDRAQIRLVRTGSHAAPWQAPAHAARVATIPTPPSPGERFQAVRLLSLDAHGRILDWMSWQDAACLYARGAVAWTLGDP